MSTRTATDVPAATPAAGVAEGRGVPEADLQYWQIFEATTDGLVVNDPDTGLVVAVNPAFCRMHGYADDELVGVHPSAFIHPDDQHLFAEFLDTFRTGGRFHARARDVRKDGSVFDVEVHAAAFIFRGKPHLLGIVRDVSDGVRAQRLLEREIADRTRELTTLVEISRLITVTPELPALFASTLRLVRSLVGCDGVHLYLARDGGYTLEHSEGPPAVGSVPFEELDELTAPLWHGENVLLPAGTAGRRADQAAAAGIMPPGASLIAVPLATPASTIGFLALHRVCVESEQAPRVMQLALAVASQLAVAVTNVRLAEVARANAALAERQRIARDLHDAVSQTLFSATMHARAAEMALDRAGLPVEDPTRRQVNEVVTLTRGALAELRSLIFELRPGALAETGLAVAVRKHADALTARHQIPIEVRAPEDRLPLDTDVEEQLYRIAQEALANIVRHAGATHVTVELWQNETDVVLRVTDDGAGFDAEQERPGHLGLHTMRERATSAGGTLDVAAGVGTGTTVTARVPLGAK